MGHSGLRAGIGARNSSRCGDSGPAWHTWPERAASDDSQGPGAHRWVWTQGGLLRSLVGVFGWVHRQWLPLLPGSCCGLVRPRCHSWLSRTAGPRVALVVPQSSVAFDVGIFSWGWHLKPVVLRLSGWQNGLEFGVWWGVGQEQTSSWRPGPLTPARKSSAVFLIGLACHSKRDAHEFPRVPLKTRPAILPPCTDRPQVLQGLWRLGLLWYLSVSCSSFSPQVRETLQDG